MAVTAKFSKPLQVVETPEMRGRIIACAEAREVSQAQICREMFLAGIEAAERVAGLR